MKILLFIDYGPNYVHPLLEHVYQKDENFPKNRTGAIIDFIENYNKLIDSEKVISLAHDESIIYKFNELQQYLIWNSKKNNFSIYMIQDVDITRPWTIKQYDGSEYIEYLDYNIVDSELNYCENKK